MRDSTKLMLLLGVLAGCIVLAFTSPIPGPAEIRALAVSAGVFAPIAMFCGYALLTALPLPRTVFSLASGLLLGNALGIVVAMTATVTSAVLGYHLARLAGKDLLGRHLHRESVRTADARLAGGGAIAVASLRLIPIVPFAPLSYCCGLSSIRLRPYLTGTAIGSLPGTAAVVVLGDAITGATPPSLIACYAAFALVGALGVYRIARTPAPTMVPEPSVAGDIGG